MSTQHISDELPRLLTGEASRSVVLAAADHLRDCPDCQQDLVSAVVAHASLVSAHRYAPELVGPSPSREEAEDGRAHDDDAQVSKLPHSGAHSAGPSPTVDDGDARTPGPLPDMSHVFRQAREEASASAAASASRSSDTAAGRHTTVPPARARGLRGPRALLVAAAAVVLLAAGGTVGGVVVSDQHTSSSASRTFALEPYGLGQQAATATLTGSTVKIDAVKLPRLDRTHVYELWVTNTARTEMQPVGVIGNDNTAELTVSPKVLSRYTDFEVSVQPAGQIEHYSRISVLRGAYA